MIEIIINILFLFFSFLLCYPTYKWLQDLQIKSKKIPVIVSIIVFLVILSSLFEIRNNLFNHFGIKDYGVEYQ